MLGVMQTVAISSDRLPVKVTERSDFAARNQRPYPAALLLFAGDPDDGAIDGKRARRLGAPSPLP